MKVQSFARFMVIPAVVFSTASVANSDKQYENWLARFKQADMNNSGGLSKAELDKTAATAFKQIKRQFTAIDANKDGQVTPVEYGRYLDGKRTEWVTDFNKADLNKSGGLSSVELGKTGTAQFLRLKRHFVAMDANKDGQVTIAESDGFTPTKPVATVWRDVFKKADVNDSGGLVRTELDKTPSDALTDLKKDFLKVDINRDGHVTYAEYEAYLEDDDDEDESSSFSWLKNLLGKN